MRDYTAYAIDLRRRIHQYPEIGYDLTRTLELVRGELDRMGIPYTEEYGKSSIVATIHPELTNFTIGLRADMDALPIQEQDDRPYCSRIPGAMHACGHDAHTANLLAVAQELTDRKDEIKCRVKLLFTPAEEYVDPGCKHMVENGVMDDIDIAIAGHVTSDADVGKLLLHEHSPGANSMGLTIEFFGKASHAAQQHGGCDAIRMGVEAYQSMETMVAHEINPAEPRLLNVGVFQGGKTNNIICDYCKLFVSCRAHSDEVSEYMQRRITEICQGIAAIHGGSARVTVNKFLPYVYNHPTAMKMLVDSAAEVIGKENILYGKRPMGGEDFGYLSRKKPCAFFHIGTRGENPNTAAPGHSVNFDIDEGVFAGFRQIMVQFVLDHMGGFGE